MDDDAAWRRACDRLGLNNQPNFTRYPDRDNPATFKLVVTAVVQYDPEYTIEISQWDVTLRHPFNKSVQAPTLYEAVIKAFGGRPDIVEGSKNRL